MITPTQEDYLRAIYLLSTNDNLEVKVSDIVVKLDLSKSTVAQRLNDLTDKGWLLHEKYGPVVLTEEGRQIASDLTYKHRIIETFLHEILDLDEMDVHEEAHKLEHAVSDKVIMKMANMLDDPTHCPHGKELPDFSADNS
jgi:DtxR family Mn-dependent transcriptional regulator